MADQLEEQPPHVPGFALRRRLGKGGMGTVWLAEDERTHQSVALKVMPAESEADLVARFDREALIGQRLRHPDIVTCYDAGRADEVLWIAMEYLDGFELTRAMYDEAFGFDDRLQVLIRVALALAYAHEQGVVHRDVKPSNVFMTHDGGVRLLDFGIARTADQQRLTQTNRSMGTPRYMAPEQVMGSSVDGRADLFALGVVAYELFAGVHPWEAGGRSPALLYLAVLASAPAPLTDTFQRSRYPIDEGQLRALAEVIHRALAAQPEQRQADAGQLARELEAVRAGARSSAEGPITPVTDPRLLAERRIEWARARAARLMIEGQVAPASVAPPPVPAASEHGAERAWLGLVVVFAAALVALAVVALRT